MVRNKIIKESTVDEKDNIASNRHKLSTDEKKDVPSKDEGPVESQVKNVTTQEERKLIAKKEKELQKKEKLLKKKLAYHRLDRNERDDDEDSIYCIAPAAPTNQISLVQFVVCGVKGFKRCLIICAVFQFVLNALQFVVIYAMTFMFPVGFGNEFSRVKSDFINHPMFIITMSCGPVLTLIWLILTIIISTKSKICCCKHKGNWFLRAYYAYSPIFLIFPATATFLTVFFVGTMNKEDLERVMYKHMHLYDSDTVSTQYWDDTQRYFHCCGVDEEGWRNWENRDQIVEDVVDWIVPESCCRNKMTKIKCQNETVDELVWDRGCFNDVFSLHNTYSSLTICILVGNMFFNAMSIIFSTRLYKSIRAAGGHKIDFHVATYFVDCFTCCRCCKHIPSSNTV